MKTTYLMYVIFGFMVLTFGACNKDDNSDNNTPNSSSADQTKQIVESGSWRVTSFIDSGNDETSDFDGYSFSFSENGTVTATKGSETVNGTWSITDDNSNSSSDDDGDSTDDDDFILFFAVPADSEFEDLNDDWDFITVSNSKIELIDVSGGNGGTDYLTFEKS